MTTIAYQKGVLAADKMASDNDLASKGAGKVVLTDDYVYAVAGSITQGLRFIDWLEADREDDAPKSKSATVIRMDRKTGKVVIFEGTDYELPVEDSMFAWGSGGHLAIGAMAAGADPVRAVEIASKWDTGSGLGVQVYYSDAAARRLKKQCSA